MDYLEVALFLLISLGLAILILLAALFAIYLFKVYHDKKRITYIERGDGQTKIVRDNNGNVIRVDNVKHELPNNLKHEL